MIQGDSVARKRGAPLLVWRGSAEHVRCGEEAQSTRLEKQHEVERKRIQDLKKRSAEGPGGLLQFGSGTSELLESAFKKETVGLVTREQFVEKRVDLRTKLEEEKEKEKQRTREQRHVQKRKKRRVKGTSRLYFADEVDGETDEEGEAAENRQAKPVKQQNSENLERIQALRRASYPTEGVLCYEECGGWNCREREAEEQAERERLRSEWLHQQSRIKNEPLEITYSYWDGAGHRRVIQSRKGDTIAEFLRAVQQQLASEFREIRTASVENLLYVKEDLIIPHQHSFYELIINKARGRSGPTLRLKRMSRMLEKLLSAIGMRRTSISFRRRDGRFMTSLRGGSDTQSTVTEWRRDPPPSSEIPGHSG